MPEASACILRILLRCGMIAGEEQEFVRGLLIRPALRPRAGAGKTLSGAAGPGTALRPLRPPGRSDR